MQEYVTRAVVLDKEARGGDADARYYFFTERFGKVAARAKSSRKIVSKLAGHLEPGTLAAVRIIEQHGAQVVDALAASRVAVPIADLAALSTLLAEWQPEAELWHELARGSGATEWPAVRESSAGERFSWTRALAILGWDPNGAICVQCNAANRPARHFSLARQEFFCAPCAGPRAGMDATSRFRQDALIFI